MPRHLLTALLSLNVATGSDQPSESQWIYSYDDFYDPNTGWKHISSSYLQHISSSHDDDERCSEWARAGYCEQELYQASMEANCARSCAGLFRDTDSFSYWSYDYGNGSFDWGSPSGQYNDYFHDTYGAYEVCMLRTSNGLAMTCEEAKNDGECDMACNTATCEWDGEDCKHDDDGCYVQPDGNDYRGTVSQTEPDEFGVVNDCAVWSDERVVKAYQKSFGVAYGLSTSAFPDAHLGGHNHCRNPDHGIGQCTDGSDCERPWCLYWRGEASDSGTIEWGFCDVGPPSTTCPGKPDYFTHDVASLPLDKFVRAAVAEHSYNYFSVAIPAELTGVQIVLVPMSGVPRLLADFDVLYPTGHNASYQQLTAGVSVMRMDREMYGFCGSKGQGEKNAGACTLHVSVLADEEAEYDLAVLDLAKEDGLACAAPDGEMPACDWTSIGDGDCDPQCKTDSCFNDRGDCAADRADNCPAECHPDWKGDGYCDAPCFSYKCSWDGGDCDGQGCADQCFAHQIEDGKCDPECNVRSCHFDGRDCFHGHHECYTRQKGDDYRGTVSHTVSGKQCQMWSLTEPHQHVFSQTMWPHAGVGGHNFCRNPDRSDDSPWCYTADPDTRFERCEVGEPQDECPPPPPPRNNFAVASKLRYWPHSPPSPSPPPSSPPPSCPEECMDLGENGKCDSECNSAVCLWDMGDCGDILENLVKEIGAEEIVEEGRLAKLKMLMSTDLSSSNGEALCEGHGYDAEQCEAVGCCQFAFCPANDGTGECHSNVGAGACASVAFDTHVEQGAWCAPLVAVPAIWPYNGPYARHSSERTQLVMAGAVAVAMALVLGGAALGLMLYRKLVKPKAAKPKTVVCAVKSAPEAKIVAPVLEAKAVAGVLQPPTPDQSKLDPPPSYSM